VAGLVARWVRLYTRQLPPPIAERRAGEIDADLHDHIAHERARGTSDGRIAFSILSRMARGLPADASWRWWVRPPKGNPLRLHPLKLVLALLAVAIGVAAMAAGEADDSPGLGGLGLILIVATVALSVRAARRSS
jgi:hypothetical protein